MTPNLSPPSALGAFSKIPAELRNEVYRLALTTANPIEIARYSHSSSTAHVHTCKGRITVPAEEVDDSKDTRKLPAGQFLALELLCTSKGIRDEATPILYGMNLFRFMNNSTMASFNSKIGGKGSLLAHVSVAIRVGPCGTDAAAQLDFLNELANPKLIELRILQNYKSGSYSMHTGSSAGILAEHTWQIIKPVVAVEEILHADGMSSLAVSLPEELQLKRLDTFQFVVESSVLWELSASQRSETIKDAGERSAKFKGLVIGALKEDAWNAREEDRRKRDEERRRQDVIAEMLRSGQPFRPSAAARSLAFEGT